MTDFPQAGHQTRERIIWLNGEFLPESQARISPFDRGLLFGDGLFETIRAQNGKPMFLSGHLDRMRESARQFNLSWDNGLDWEGILNSLLRKNNLGTGLARAKIVLTRGCAPGLGLPHGEHPTCLALAENYLPPSPGAYAHGWDLFVSDQCVSPPLSPHKSLNYLFYMAAKQQAIDNGCHEALILDKDGLVVETCTASLLAYDSDGWFTPASPWQLPGTAFKQVERLLGEQGQMVRRRQIMVKNLLTSRWVWATNSLIGIMPVRSVAGHPMGSLNSDLADTLRARLFSS